MADCLLGAVIAAENDVVFEKLDGYGGVVNERWRVGRDAEEAFGGDGFAVAEPVWMEVVHAGSVRRERDGEGEIL